MKQSAINPKVRYLLVTNRGAVALQDAEARCLIRGEIPAPLVKSLERCGLHFPRHGAEVQYRMIDRHAPNGPLTIEAYARRSRALGFERA